MFFPSAYDPALTPSLFLSQPPPPFHSVRISYVDVKLFALNCVHVWKGWPRIDLVMRSFWQYFEYIYFSTFNILYIYSYMQTISDHAIGLTVFKQFMYAHYISEVISVSFVVPLGDHYYFILWLYDYILYIVFIFINIYLVIFTIF